MAAEHSPRGPDFAPRREPDVLSRQEQVGHFAVVADGGVVDPPNPVHVDQPSCIEFGLERIDVGHFLFQRTATASEVVPVLFVQGCILGRVPCGGGQASVVTMHHKAEFSEERMVGRWQTRRRVKGHRRLTPPRGRCSRRQVVSARRGDGPRIVGPAQAGHAIAAKLVTCLNPFNGHAGLKPHSGTFIKRIFKKPSGVELSLNSLLVEEDTYLKFIPEALVSVLHSRDTNFWLMHFKSEALHLGKIGSDKVDILGVPLNEADQPDGDSILNKDLLFLGFVPESRGTQMCLLDVKSKDIWKVPSVVFYACEAVQLSQ